VEARAEARAVARVVTLAMEAKGAELGVALAESLTIRADCCGGRHGM